MTAKTSKEVEKQIFKAIENGDSVLLKTSLATHPNVNIIDDENLMTPLQHAAYKGSKEMVQLLLDYGGDPNFCKHQHNYTALHFAGLSGNLDVCLALLVAGAQTNVTNTVNRTAAQMAAFVGHHNCVAAINNYIPKSDVDYYTSQAAPLLPPFLSESFHKFIMQINVHPVKIVTNLFNLAGLADHLPKVHKVLELMCEKEMKRGAQNNEVMALKYHYLHFLVGEVMRIKDKQSEVVDIFCKKILKPNEEGSLEILDGLLRDCVKQFPFKQSTLFRQMVSTLAGKDPPTALSVVSSAINGQRGFIDNVALCQTCGEEKPAKKCSKCKSVQYCDKNCQRLHWYWHKKVCGKLAEQGPKEEELNPAPDASELAAEVQNLIVQN